MKSNHPSSIVKQLPIIVNKRISDLSCDENSFNDAKVIYELDLKHGDIRSKWRSIDNRLSGETEIEQSFVLTLRWAKTLRLENSFLN